MTRRDADRAIRRHIRRLGRLAGLEAWTIEWVVGRTSDGEALAEVVVAHEYSLANITVDHQKHDDERHLLATLCHEVAHIVCSSIEAAAPILYALVQEEGRRAAELALTQGIEQSVCRLEKILLRLHDLEYGD